MISGFKNQVTLRTDRILSALRDKLTFRNTIGVSLFLHIFVGMAVASVFLGKQLINPPSEELIEFELVTDQELVEQSRAYSSDINPIDLFPLQNSASSLAGKASELSSSVANSNLKNQPDRNAMLFASFETLSELRESFSFLELELTSSSATFVAPIQGAAPDVSTLAAGLASAKTLGNRGSGMRVGIGGGGGNCPPGGGTAN